MVAKLRLIPQPSDSSEQGMDSPSLSFPGWAKLLFLGLTVTTAVAIYVYCEGGQRRSLRRLPTVERQAFYKRTLANLRSLCAPAEDSMRSFCVDQARLALEFPDCDSVCRDLADHQLARVQLPR